MPANRNVGESRRKWPGWMQTNGGRIWRIGEGEDEFHNNRVAQFEGQVEGLRPWTWTGA